MPKARNFLAILQKMQNEEQDWAALKDIVRATTAGLIKMILQPESEEELANALSFLGTMKTIINDLIKPLESLGIVKEKQEEEDDDLVRFPENES